MPSTVIVEKQEINNKQTNSHIMKINLPKQNVLPANELQIIVLRYENLNHDITTAINNKKMYRKQMEAYIGIDNKFAKEQSLKLFNEALKNQFFIEDNIAKLDEMRNSIVHYQDFNKFYKEGYCLMDEKELPEDYRTIRFCLFLRK